MRHRRTLPNVPYHKFAELIGSRAFTSTSLSRWARRGTRRWPRTGPVVLEVRTDPEVPPLPPHITLEQAKKFTSTLLKGDPNEGTIKGIARQFLSSVLPGDKD